MSSCPHCDKNLNECLCSTKSVTSVEMEPGIFEDFSVSESNQSYRLLVPKYKHIRLLGKGAAGAVFLAEQLTLGKRVAIKFLHRNLANDSRAVKRFQTEARELSNLTHPNLVDVFDLDISAEGTPYMVMEYADGTDLKTLLSQSGTLSPLRVIEIVLQLCEALIATHKKKIVHRDLKPANVILVRDEIGTEFVKLVDFGIVKPSTEGGELQRLTLSGEIVGSPSYMSPEQIRGAEIDHRSDIYSLGCIMYEALSGKVPFRGDSMMATLSLHLDKDAEPLLTVRPELNKWKDLVSVIERCLSKEIDKRPASADQLKNDLIEVRDTRPNRAKMLKRIAFVTTVVIFTVAIMFLFPEKRAAQSDKTVGVKVPSPVQKVATDSQALGSQSTISSLVEDFARAEILFYTNKPEKSTPIFAKDLDAAIKSKAPVKTQLAIAVLLIEQYQTHPRNPKAATELYRRLKPQIDAIMSGSSAETDSLFAAYILFRYADTLMETLMAIHEGTTSEAKEGVKREQLSKEAIARYTDAMFLAKRRARIDGGGIIGGAYVGLGTINAYNDQHREARQNYKQGIDWYLKAAGPGAEASVEAAKSLVNTSILLSKQDRTDPKKNQERQSYLKSTAAVLDQVIASLNESDESLKELRESKVLLSEEMKK